MAVMVFQASLTGRNGVLASELEKFKQSAVFVHYGVMLDQYMA